MVRLINIIKENLKKNAAKVRPAASIVPGAGTSKAEKAAEPQPFESRENPYRRKASAVPQESLRERSNRVEVLKGIYREVYSAAQLAVTGIVDRGKIEEVLWKVVEAFESDPYNELLLLFYSFSKKNYLPAHMANDVVLTVAFAKSLGFSREEMKDLAVCAFCHDLGMSNFEGISKKGQQLIQQEIEDIKQHPLRSAEIVRPVFSEKIAAVVLDIHERQNGQGYPRGIPGADIHLWAKIIAVCDSFEALTHPRIFRPQYSPYEALKIVIKKKDILFEDTVVKRFIDFLSIYPVGTLVELNSGEVAIVTGSNVNMPTRPTVRILITENREIDEAQTSLNLADKDFVYIVGVVQPEKEKELLYFLKPRGQVDFDEV